MLDQTLPSPGTPYLSPDGRRIAVNSTMGVLFSDDFGGSVLDTTYRWDVYDGGLGPVTLGDGTAQAAIGSGVTGMTDAVSASALTVNMGTVASAERWYLSRRVFAGSEDVTLVMSKSAARAQNMIFIGLVEVDPISGYPLLNPNYAGWFTNWGGVDFGQTASLTQMTLYAQADSSPTVASVNPAAWASAAMTTTFEATLEYHAEDIIASYSTPDSMSGKASGAARVSSQVPNDGKAYKLLMRFKNTATAVATSVTVQRILVVDCQEHRVEVTSGRGDQNAQKAMAVNVANTSLATTASLTGPVQISALTGIGTTDAKHRLISAATTNATVVQGSNARLLGGYLYNTSAAARYVKLYNKATAPTVGVDTPALTLPLAPASGLALAMVASEYGALFATGLAYAITGAAADADTTAVAAGDVIVNLTYV